MAGRVARRAAAAVITILLALGLAPAGYASGDHLEVSVDGVTWSRALPDALFEGDIVLVPGEATASRLHLRSTAPTVGVLELALQDVTASDRDAATSFGVQLEVTGGHWDAAVTGGLPRTRFADLDENTRVGAPIHLEPGEAVTMTLTIDLDAHATGTTSQNSAIGLDLAITFTDALVAGEGVPGPGTAGDGSHGSSPAGDGPDGTGGGAAAPGRIIPVLGTEGPGSFEDPHRTAPQSEERLPPADPRPRSSDPELLAITGSSAAGKLAAGTALLLLGALLLFLSRRPHQETPLPPAVPVAPPACSARSSPVSAPACSC
ncbi:MAG: hypothetical protein ACTMH5_04660 [Brachybacterium sp.]|uniref:hypothetical protein n=1 Tax=Brachybacterium sp. TaxID=1891286 RepID=UPI003F91B76B